VASGDSRSDVPVLRPQRTLETAAGDLDNLKDIIALFIEEAPKRIEQLRQAIAREDAPDAARHAHTIKGQAAYLGGERLRDMALDAEESAASGDLATPVRRLSDMEAQFAELRVALEATDWEALRRGGD